MKQKLLSFFIGGLILTSVAFAQEKKVSGRVTSPAGTAIPGVTVSIQGSNQATQTDANGNYTIDVPVGKILVFKSLGFSESTLIVSANRSSFDIALNDSNAQLDEVVVTALGVKREKKNLGYASASISNETLTSASAVNVANGLQGKVSGLNVTTISSGVFEDVKMTLRGIRSLTGNNNPLLVIDGIPMDLKYLSSLNPNEIENVSILKGAASASIYGPDARNGVILVTTKKGTDTPVITLGHSTQFSEVSFFPKLQKKFGQGYDGIIAPVENWSWGPEFDGSIVDIGPELQDGQQQTTPYVGTDERQKFYDRGVTTQTDVSFSLKDFFVSLQDANVKGIVPDDKNRRTGIRLNSAREYGKFRVAANMNYSQQNYTLFDDNGMSDYFASQGVGGNDGLFNQLINTPAHIPLSKYKDYKNDVFAQYENYYNNYGLNPYFAIGNWRRNGKQQDLISNLELNYKPLDFLSFTYRAGLVTRGIADRNTSSGVTVSNWGIAREKGAIPGSISERNYNQNRLSSELVGTLDKQIDDDFRIKVSAGTYVRQEEYRDTRVGAGTLVVSDLFNLGNRIGNLTGSSNGYRSRLFSVFGSAELNYKGWANVEVTGRNDKTSLLSLNNNSYFYPGVSASLVLSEAIPGLKSDVLSFLKLRGAWSKTGNADISPYLLAATFSQPASSGFPFGGTSGLTAGNTSYDPNLKPEFINSKEGGLEFSLFNNRISFEGTYYHQNNTDQIISVNISEATGYSRKFLNAASFINKGFELDLNINPIVKWKDGSFKFRANATYSDTEVTSIYNEQDLKQLSIGGYVSAGNFAIVGQPAFIMRGTDYVRDDLGRVIVSEENGRPTTDTNLRDFGRTLPKWIIGLNPSVNYKNFNLSALFEHKGGHVVSFYALGADMAWTGVSDATAYNDRKPFILPNSVIEDPNNAGKYIENTTAKIGENEPIYEYYTGEFGNTASNFIVSANSWRLRELTLTYDVPANWLAAKQRVFKSVSIALVGRNLALWVPKENKFMDPDFNSMAASYENAFGNVNSTSNPPIRNYGFTINAKF